ncbi:MAG TPA: cell division protein FtsL [Spirochaetota bacterium]|nr:cell division protein FtsL [Spirochaetota bacterium]
MSSINKVIIKKIFKLTVFFGVLFSLLFCVTWQSIHDYILNLRINELTKKKHEMEKTLYLKNVEISSWKSPERIRRIAIEQLGMSPITYNDVKLIIY